MLADLDDCALFTLAIAAAHTFPVVLFQTFLICVKRNGLFSEHLSQPSKSPDDELVKRCYWNSLLNHLVVTPLGVYLAAPYLIAYIPTRAHFPSLITLLVDVLCCAIVEDTLFYWSHRLLHEPLLYKHIHKRHHEFRVLKGMSIASEFTHPVESLLGNILPVIAGPVLLNSHLATTSLWVMIRMLKTCDAHSGYNFPFSPFNVGFPLNEAKRHDFHHAANIGSFGSFFVVWDCLCGTDDAYNARQGKNKKVQ